ncbi:MAG: signal recognition particle-docking protein FtsY [Acidobacteria bacterium]|nr:signal recognition particle-docking protein FtsY [Acidobacteriota bacterium]
MFEKAKSLFRRKEGERESETTQQPKTFFTQLKQGLRKTRDQLSQRLQSVMGGRAIDDEVLEELEELLIGADLGVATTMQLMEQIRVQAKKAKIQDGGSLREILHDQISAILKQNPQMPWEVDQHPAVILIAGVNGVGKTTTIGKLAHRFTSSGKKVVLCAADTFRAAATEQLEIWAERAGVIVVTKDDSKDPASVVFDAMQRAKSEQADVVLVDTAGRLHNNPNLMNELAKIRRVTEREVAGAPHHVVLIIDAVTGQNGLHQAKQFVDKIGVSDLIITKLDGTAKGGVAVAISNELQLPIQFIGVGEKIDDLIPFNADEFVDALLD